MAASMEGRKRERGEVRVRGRMERARERKGGREAGSRWDETMINLKRITATHEIR
jgi:hypothetical protein